MVRTEIRFAEVNHTGLTPRTRRRHAKSRKGCEACKRRRIKCDEMTPKCGSCTRKGINCLRNERSRPRPSEVSQPPSIEKSPLADRGSGRRNEQASVAQPLGPDIDMLQMRLFFHFESNTRFTLVFGPVVWKQLMGLALKHKFLMHAIFMIAAAHMSYTAPESQELKTAELEHLACATAGLRETLSLRIDAGNVETVFIVCFLLFNQTWASFECSADSDHEVLPSIDADFLVYLGAGFRNLVVDTRSGVDVMQSPIFVEVAAFSPKIEFMKFLQGSNLPQEFENEFRDEYLRIWPEESGQSAAYLHTYMTECKRLTRILSVLELGNRHCDISPLEEAIVRYLYTWPMMISPEFVELMKQGAECVPLLFWHFYTTVQASAAADYWWAQRRTDFMVKSLRCRLQEGGIEPRSLLTRNH